MLRQQNLLRSPFNQKDHLQFVFSWLLKSRIADWTPEFVVYLLRATFVIFLLDTLPSDRRKHSFSAWINCNCRVVPFNLGILRYFEVTTRLDFEQNGSVEQTQEYQYDICWKRRNFGNNSSQWLQNKISKRFAIVSSGEAHLQPLEHIR